MLVAVDEQNELVILQRGITEDTLKQLRMQNLYCPQCKEKLLIKAGAIKIPHFAHQAKHSCSHQFSEGESHAHLLGKMQLYEHFTNYYDTTLEPYLPVLQQRPDLLIQKKQSYAIEFQCSRLPPDIFQQRTLGYKKHRITPIWLVKTPAFAQRDGQVGKASFNVFLQQFIQDDTLISYDPETMQFVYVSPLLYVQGNIYIYMVRTLPLSRQRFPFYKVKIASNTCFEQLMGLYSTYRQKWLYQRLFYSRLGVNDLFLRAVYDLRLNREQLPHYIGVALAGAQVIPVFSVEWQLLLFYFVYQHQLHWERLDKATINYFFSWARLVVTDTAHRVVQRYIAILQRLRIEHPQQTCEPTALITLLYDDFVAFKSKH